MRFPCLVCLLLASLSYGQAPPPAANSTTGASAEKSASATPEKAPEVKVGPDDTVITLKGFCAQPTPHTEECQTKITRAQFEKLAEALQPNMSPAIRRNLATAYARMLKMSTAADERGLDKGPRFDELMDFARMQILSQELSRALQADAGKISDEEVEAYYKKNEASYEQGTLDRIFVPRSKQITNPAAKTDAKGAAKAAANQPPTEEQKKAAEEAMDKVAAELRKRAVAGEDPDTLQKEAYAAAELPGSPLSTKMEKVRRTTLPATHQMVMDLKAGEVSEVITDPNGGHYIYKVLSKETLPLDSVKTEIRNAISSQRYRDSMQGFQGEVDLNEAYFGPTRLQTSPMHPRGPRRPDEPAEDPD
jgi:bifunctional DNA-binding transcriptional regulator/antitoxin component of YhaV-PrlF toxin-antitoxin module